MSSREGSPVLQEKSKNDKEVAAATAVEDSSKENGEKVFNADDLIDMSTFEQLLDMDDDDDHDFSKSIVENYFEQADSTFIDMDKALESKDLIELSRLGHFLKGSSAAIGLTKVKATCEKIQNVGNRQEEDGTGELSEQVALERITPLLPQVKKEYGEAEEYLKHFYEVEK